MELDTLASFVLCVKRILCYYTCMRIALLNVHTFMLYQVDCYAI